MARVYISFLGTNNYLECYYCRGDETLTPEPVRFVQEATVRDNCSDWGPEDRIIIFTTKDAEARNWHNDGHTDKDGNIIQLKGLLACLEELNLPVTIAKCTIPEGYDEDQVWEIFQKVFDSLKPGDEVVFDITHAFRSIPLLAIIVLQYARIMKGVTLRGIYYGAFEALPQVKQKPAQDRRAPIVDLTALNGLMDWSLATDRFLENGDVRFAGTLAKKGVQGILKETRGGDKAAQAIMNLGSSLEQFGKMLSTCRGPEISSAAVDLLEKCKTCKDTNLPQPFQPLFEKIRARIELNFTGDSLRDGLAAARWCADHNLIQQGYTILMEILISFVVSGVGLGLNPLDRSIRYLASDAFIRVIGGVPVNGSDLEEKPRKVPAAELERMVELLRSYEGLHRAVEKIRPKRNDLNHAGFREDRILLRNADNFAVSLHQLIAEVEEALQVPPLLIP